MSGTRDTTTTNQARRWYAALMCLALLAATATPVFADAPVLPTTGVDIAAWIPVVVTAMGTIVAAVVGAHFAFLVIRRGIRWARKAFG